MKEKSIVPQLTEEFKQWLCVLLIICTTLTIGSSKVFAQSSEEKVTINVKDVEASVVFKAVEEQTSYKFFYRANQVKDLNKITINVTNEPISKVLDLIFKGSNLTYSIVEKQIVILEKKSQEQTIVKGKVTDKKGEPLIGVAVIIKGSSTGVTTNLEGEYQLNIDATSNTLLFKFMGMKDVEAVIPPSRILNITMEEDTKSIDEVIVTGYGNFKKSSYTGSASVMNTDKLRNLPVTSMTQMMEGVIPGVSFSSSSGQAGSKVSLRVRGRASLNASTEPLYVIDGIPVSSSDVSSFGTSAGGTGMLATLNPKDIESITVLKDAASASLCGARGANGVILITTKQGKEGKSSYKFNASFGISDLAYTYREIMGGEERRELIHEGFVNAQLDEGKTQEQAEEYADTQTEIYAPVPANGYADWEDALFRKGTTQSYDFTATGGNSKNNFIGSLGYVKEEGISIHSGFERMSGRLAYNHKNKGFEISMSSMFSHTRNTQTLEDQYYASAIYTSRVKITPSIPIYNEDGTYNRDISNNGNYNPLYENEQNQSFVRIIRSFNTFSAGYTIIKGLKLSTVFSVDYYLTKDFKYFSPESSDGKANKGFGNMKMNENLRYNSQTRLNYNFSLGNHNFDALVAYEIQKLDHDDLHAQAKNYGQLVNTSLANASTPVYTSQIINEDALLSYVGRLNYDYNNKYYLSFSFRRDGSSRLAAKTRWGNFWSLSGSWRVTGESFLAKRPDWLTDVKIRASYGVNGNLPSGVYAYHGTYSTSNSYNGESAIVENSIPNRELTWEKNYAFDFGVDLTLFNRFNIVFDYYTRKTKDLLMSKQLNNVSGFGSVTANIGEMENKGFEFDIKTVNIQNDDFMWSSALNLSHNKNKIIALADLPEYGEDIFIRKEGYSFGTFYLREWAGVDPENGLPMYYKNEKDEDGNIISRDIVNDPNEATPILSKDMYPKLTGGFTNNFSYKFIDLSFNLTFSLGGWSYDNGMWALQDDGYSSVNNKSVELRKRWKKPGDKTNVPRYVAGQEFGGHWHSTRAVHSTDHIRLKSLTLGVSAPEKWLTPLRLSSARLYFSGTNLLTLAVYDQYDPELNGMVSFDTPPLKYYSFGLELSF